MNRVGRCSKLEFKSVFFLFRTFCANVTVQFMNTETDHYETAMMCVLDTKNQVKDLRNKPKVSSSLTNLQ